MIEYRFVREKELLLEYAAGLNDTRALEIITRGHIDTADEARALGKFYWRMVDASIGDDIESWLEYILTTLSGACRNAGFAAVWDEEVDNA